MSGHDSDFTKSQQLNPKRVTTYRKIWLQIKDNGYDVIPLATGKDRPFKGWPNQPNSPADIARWSGRAAAIRMFGSLLIVLDIDVLHVAANAEIIALAQTQWPEFMRACLQRHSGGVKIAFIGRRAAAEDKRYLPTWRYEDPTEVSDEKGRRKGQRVEIFTGCDRRYVGVHGAHSVGREYGYYGRSILDVPAAELPELIAEPAAIYRFLDACEAIMERHGLVAVKPTYGKTDKPIVYDIDESTRFDVLNGPDQVDYDELVELFDTRDEVRVSSSFADGGSNRSKCRVGQCRLARCVGVFDHEEHVWHCPKSADPKTVREGIGETIRKMAEDAGAKTSQKPKQALNEPNWREKYVGTGLPKPSLYNAIEGMIKAGVVCAQNAFSGRQYIARVGGGSSPLSNIIAEIDDQKLALLRGWLSNRYAFDMTEKHLYDAIKEMCALNPFDPVADMLTQAQNDWDGVARLDRMAVDYFNAEDTPLNRAFVRKFMLACVARVRTPGCKFDQILTLESKEGWNKSSAFRVLAGDEYFADANVFGKDHREVLEITQGSWIIEVSELAGMSKTEVGHVKAFASRTEDKARLAWGHYVTVRLRRFLVVGTTNKTRYLLSQDGNRRFWPMPVLRPIDLEKLQAARLQLWGEAAHCQSLGESLVLPKELWEEAGKVQEERRIEHTWEVILAGLAPCLGAENGTCVIHTIDNREWVSTEALFTKALAMPGWRMNGNEVGKAAEAMGKLGWTADRFYHPTDKRRVRGYYRVV